MKQPTVNHYLVETPAMCFTFVGQAEPDGEFIWLCALNGKRLLRVPREQVRESSPEETAHRIVEDRRAALARN